MADVQDSLLSVLPGMLYRCLPDERFTMLSVSEGATELLGYAPTELVGADAVPWRSIIHPDDHEHGRQIIASAVAARRRFESSFRFCRKDGQVRWGFVRGQGLFGDDGQLEAIQGFIQDITAFRELEDAKRDALASLQAFFNAEHIGFSVIKMTEQGDDAVFVLPSVAIARYYAMTPDELRGKRMREVQPNTELVRQFIERAEWALRTRERQLWTVQSSTAGVRLTFLLSMVVLDRWDGQPDHLAIAAVDITRQSEAEERLRRMQKVEAIGVMAAGLAHDFNNVLTTLTAHVDLLTDTLRAPASTTLVEEIDEELLAIRRAIDAGAELTKRLLLVARRGPAQARVVDVNAMLDTVGLLARRLLGKTVTVNETRSAPLPFIRADGGQIEQALLNLVVNARDAMPDGGTLSIEGSVTTSPDGARRMVVISVADTGMGMSRETLARAFEPFYTTKPEGHGTGLGLAMVLDACQQAGGHVDVQSEPGQGTRFELHLPVYEDVAP